MNLATQKVVIEDREIDLSVREFHILYQLAQHPGRIYSMEELYELVWGNPCVGDLRTVMVHISNLRKKLKTNVDDIEIIETVRGAGYRFNEKVLKHFSKI
ncbi:winged helix-turn-helix domain-containing protein [Bacillaceae bacterium S4-13-58]